MKTIIVVWLIGMVFFYLLILGGKKKETESDYMET